MPVALVTDSTASLPEGFADEHGVVVVPLQVVIGTTSFDEGSEEASPAVVAKALREKVPVSTSRPTPRVMRAVYEQAAASGATAVVSVHLSADLSGTFESAQLAAQEASLPVEVVDSRQVGPSLGFAVMTAAARVADGGAPADVAEAARSRALATTSLFYVDTLEYLRRGGRIGAARAMLGSALAVKPILALQDGRVGPLERVRTSGRALARLEDLAVEAGTRGTGGTGGTVDVAVSHLAAAERAEHLAASLATRLEGALEGRPVHVSELGGVLGAHVGPGFVAVSVAPVV
ncbi:DegV family protein [Nocardioides mangrovicus]|uniref:DegV family protein n=1 Tax=Nocardioides mangrovicus TaxID=2478913 RepID=A0A3L8P2P7_9ACTN|nr:DegV family protein [Nocardioides mangrovicus]RLV49610.1 DegV family protein [Nocardioides mangrovicus]